MGGRDGGSTVKKEVLKERLLQLVPVTTQLAISKRVSRFKIQLRDCQEARSRGREDDRPIPIAWGWSLGYGLGFIRLERTNT